MCEIQSLRHVSSNNHRENIDTLCEKNTELFNNAKPDDICDLLGYYAACSGNPLPTFRDNVSVPFSRVKRSSVFRLLDP
jgi:hypothetical protein